MSVLYNPGKDNVVTDALSRVSMGSVTHMVDDKEELVNEFHKLAHQGFRIEGSPKDGFLVRQNSESSLVGWVEMQEKP